MQSVLQSTGVKTVGFSDIQDNAGKGITCRSKNNNGIDLIKFLCAILVFVVHIPPFGEGSSRLFQNLNYGLQHGICRIAVPFYFICVGYFLFLKTKPDALDVNVIRNYCFKILRLLGLWYMLLFIGPKRHLWYFGATVVAVVVLSVFFYCRVKIVYLYAIAGVLFALGLLGDSYYGLLEPLKRITIIKYVCAVYEMAFSTTRNGVFMGFIYVLMGVGFSQHPPRWKSRTAFGGFLVSVLLMLGEVFLLKRYGLPKEYNMYIFQVPAAYFLFCFAYALPLRDRAAYPFLRNMGFLLYVSHIFINECMEMVLMGVEKFLQFRVLPYQFLFSLVVSLAITGFLTWLSSKEKWKWLSWMLT